jgi:predicted NAD/FAD-binding protein
VKVAVIGSGISGNVAAYRLAPHHDITLFEKRDRPGGHSATKDIDYDGTGKTISVDTGFIVYNELNYPGLTSLFNELNIDTLDSNMSFAFSANGGAFEWSGQSLKTVFAQPSNIFKPRFWLMLREIFRFNKLAATTHEENQSRPHQIDDISLGAWLDQHRFGSTFRTRYLLPMGAAIWSTPADEMLKFPAASFLQFFYNHRLINADRPAWRTVKGGSRNYVNKLTRSFVHNMRLDAEVTNIVRTEQGVAVTANGVIEHFDQVVIATHSDQALAMLGDADEQEQEVLSAVRYLPNQVYLHRDPKLMPKRKQTWSAWNYLSHEGDTANAPIMTVSYWMNRLQSLPADKPLFVTLNPPTPPAPELTFGHYVYDHPQFDHAAMAAQEKLKQLQGTRNIWFCGAWTGFGFHEDGLQSAVRVCDAISQVSVQSVSEKSSEKSSEPASEPASEAPSKPEAAA